MHMACLKSQVFAHANEVRTEILIHSKPEKVWNILTDFNQYSQWHPYITHIQGKLKKGKQLKVTYLDKDNKLKKFSAYVLDLDTNKTLSWGGSLGFIFRAKHYFMIEEVNDSTVKFIQGEYWRGMFGKGYGKKIYEQTFNKFNAMNERLKQMAESGEKYL